MHSHCEQFTVTVPKNLHMQTCGVWMAAWLEHAECQLQAVDQVFFAVLPKRYPLKSYVIIQKKKRNISISYFTLLTAKN